MCDHTRSVCFLTLNYAKQREMLTAAGEANLWVKRYLLCERCGNVGLQAGDRLSWVPKIHAGYMTESNYKDSKRLRARLTHETT